MARRENWLKHDIDSRLGLKMDEFFREHGFFGYGFFWVLIETLYRAEGHRLANSSKTKQSLAKGSNVKQISILLEKLFELGLLEFNDEYIWSPRVNFELKLEVAHQAEISQKRSEAGQLGGLAKKAAVAKGSKRKQKVAKPSKTDRGEERRGDNIYTAGESVKVHYPTPDSPVLLTEIEIEKLIDTLGSERFDFLTGELANFSTNKPKQFREYNSHYQTLLNWNKRKIQEGMDFYIHEQHGPGYYKQPQR